MPLANKDVIRLIHSQRKMGDAVIPELEKINPLFGIYHKEKVLPIVDSMLRNKQYKLLPLLEEIETHYIDSLQLSKIDPDLEFALNFNSLTEYQHYLNQKK